MESNSAPFDACAESETKRPILVWTKNVPRHKRKTSSMFDRIIEAMSPSSDSHHMSDRKVNDRSSN